jgi:signal transduction histidine kinase
MLAFNCAEQRFEIAAHRGQLEVILSFQKAAYTFTDEQIVLGEHNPDRHDASIRCIMAAGGPNPMGNRAATRFAWSLWALAVTLAALHLVVMSLGGLPQESESLGSAGGIILRVLYVLTVALLATMGALIASRQAGNVIGWLCCVWGLLFALEMFASEYASSTALASSGSVSPGAVWMAWLAQMLNIHIVLIVPVLLLFPDGHLPARRWGFVLWLVAGCAGLSEAFLAIRPGPLGSAPEIANPLGITGLDSALIPLYRLSIVGVVVAALLAATALALRLSRTRGDERQQLKWIAYAGVLLAIAFLAGFSAPREFSLVVQLLYFVVLDAFLLTLGLAILKYRLYDIDLVINKTLVYSALGVLIACAYVAVVVGIGALIGTRGESNLALSLVATAIVAVAFQPLRERLQRLANQVVYGQRLSPYDVLSEFSRRMAEALSADDVLPRMAEAATRGVGGVRSRVRVYVPGGRDLVIAWPADAIAESFDRTVLVLHQGTPVGEIAVSKPPGEPLTSAEGALLADLAAQAGPALSNVRLTLELQARLAELATQAYELRASRQRIVAAQDVERRRLERDIHDGAQQHLVAIAVNARLARQVLETAPARTGTLLDEISAQADDALDTLRNLARGIFPAVLADRGLVPALRAQLTKSTYVVRLEVNAALARARFDPPVEAAIYFCCLEALQNAAKHAPHAPVSVRISADDAWLMFEVVDQGPGFDTSLARPGTGLEGMADRLAAVGGALTIESSVGRGATVGGRVPVRNGLTDPQADAVAAAQAVASRSEPNSDLVR